MKLPARSSLKYIPLFSLLSCARLFASPGLDETFVHSGADLGLPPSTPSSYGWSQVVIPDNSAELGSAVISAASGSGGGVGELSLLKRQTYVVYESKDPVWSDTDGPLVIKVDLKYQGDMPFDLAIHNGRTSGGFYLNFDTHEKRLLVSQGGGASVFRGEQAKHELQGLKPGVWYTLEIRGLQLSSSGANTVQGMLYFYEAASPINSLIDGVSVVSSGQNPFAEIKTIQIRRWGSVGRLDIDNVVIKRAPRP